MLDEIAIRRVYEFHDFLERWLGGVMPYDLSDVHAQLENFDPDFQCLLPTGRVQDRVALLNWLAEAFGSQPGLGIKIEKVNVRWRKRDSVLLTYEEHQSRPDGSNRRLSSALFAAGSEDRNTGLWFHLHEVMLEDAPSDP